MSYDEWTTSWQADQVTLFFIINFFSSFLGGQGACMMHTLMIEKKILVHQA